MDPTVAPLLDWIHPFLPSAGEAGIGGALSALYLVAVAALVGWLRIRRGVSTPYTRKVFHFLVFSAATGLHLVGGLGLVTVFGTVVAAGVIVAVVRGEGDPFYEALARPRDAPRRTLLVVVPLLSTVAGGLLANLFLSPWAPVGYMVTGWGDAAGEPVGTRWGRHRYRVPSIAGVQASRSLEGSAAVFLVGTLAAVVTLASMGLPARPALITGVACGAAGTAIEAVSSHGLDNLTLQIGVAAVARLLLG